MCQRKVLLTPTCPFCNEDETIAHCLLLCPQLVEIWIACGFRDVQAICRKVGLDNTSKILATLVDEVGILAPLIMWNLWISRNKSIYPWIRNLSYSYARIVMMWHVYLSSNYSFPIDWNLATFLSYLTITLIIHFFLST